MTITASLAPEPYWYIVNTAGTAAGGARMSTRSSQNHEQEKLVYKDAGMTIPWDNPIEFGLNGVQGPFYWAFDDAFPDELYYIFVEDADGNLLWDLDDFQGGSGGGGGGNVVTYQPLVNLIANNQFIDHCDDTTTTLVTNLVIAPSNHKGFTPALINPVVGTNGVVGPDIRFLKNSTANTDSITFETFPLASAPMNPSDVTPVTSIRYVCATGNAGESLKCFQFPITQKVKNLSNQPMTFKVWAKATTAVAIQPYSRQYFGSNAATASPEVKNPIGGAITLTTSWVQYNVNFTLLTVAAESLGTPGTETDDDALYIQLEMPRNTICDISFTKPKLYLGTINPTLDFETYDQINAVNSTPRTGDIKTSLLSSAPQGWVAMADNTIGNVGSGATRANKDTFQLFKTIWDGVFNNTFAPILTSGGVASTYGATAVADFIANKRLTLPRSLGRALAGAGAGAGLTARALGEWVGSETHTLIKSELPDPITTTALTVPTPGTPGGDAISSSAAYGTGTVSNSGGNQAHTIMQPTSFFNVFIKL